MRKKFLFFTIFLLFYRCSFSSEKPNPDGFSSYFRLLSYRKFLKKQEEKKQFEQNKKKKKELLLRKVELKRRKKEKKKQKMVQVKKVEQKMTSDMIERTLKNFQEQKTKDSKAERDIFSSSDFFSSNSPSEKPNPVQGSKNFFKLNGVVLFENEKKAIINNEIYKVGDFLDSSTRLIQVENRYICLMHGNTLLKIDIPGIHSLKENNMFLLSDDKNDQKESVFLGRDKNF